MATYHGATKEELADLTQRLGFGVLPDSQDWDLMCAHADRVLEFVEFYQSSALSDAQRFEMAALILASLDEAYRQGSADSETTAEIEKILLTEPQLHEYHIRYWAKPKASEGWAITPLMRRILMQIKSQS